MCSRIVAPVRFAVLLAATLTPATLLAAPYYVGPKTCQECHKSEYDVWEKTKHALSFGTLHRAPKVKDILDAAGGESNVRRNTLCTQCHYTLEQADESATAAAKSSVSCESCHGVASGWVRVHNDYGGPGVKRETEPAAHKTERIAKSIAAGMRRPDSLYDLAANCLNCHSLARAGLDGAIVGKMLAAGHPINADYELVKYWQGTVRHRFYPPNNTVNAELSPADLARMFVVGRAAMLVTATGALGKSDNAAYKDAMQKQIHSATAALNAVKSVPEAGALVSAPTEANARKLVEAIAGKDLSAEVRSLLPAPADYK
jgi:mono/diheme cytochrome c family protein